MRLLLALAVMLASGCGGGGIDNWKGSWTGGCEINTGRQPVDYTGTLVVTDAALFTLTSNAQGTPSQAWSCALTATSVDSGKATFAVPSNCTLTATPPDDCSYQVTLTTITASLAGDLISATASGHLTSTCTSSSNVNEDFGVMSGTAKRQ